ncbi:leukocyte immunoglobulin-like receptor subfamily B member 4 isoform X3 [Vombatus ursinus]|uniref:leukocyte immunoglobulin-like receptor subfamily B member 4 isoform X3 n=1 Tax=Vombatus ursinus TaxID=29139 RepID=UPI000FFD5C36|nr:leukocyte immunoglobulin-like receptor subfamily B member 4 isoform X3 [Vombatus ursinus]
MKVSASPQPWPLPCSSSPSQQPLGTKDKRVKVGLMGVTRRGKEGVRGPQGKGITSWSSGPASLPDTFTRPSLWAEPGTLIPVGTNVTLWCRGPAGATRYCVLRVGLSECRSPSRPQTEVQFPILSAANEDAGQYCCLYWTRSLRSQCSHPLELVVTGIYEKPTLLALPSHSVGTGKDVILQCKVESRSDSFSSDSPYHWSAPSDPLKLIVTETSPRPGTQDDLLGASSGLPRLWQGILTGVSLLSTLLFLFFVLLCHHQHLARLKTEGRASEGKETLRSYSPAGALQEETLYTAVKSSRQSREEDPAAQDLQEVTYTQLRHPSPSEGPAWAPSHPLCTTGHPVS